MARAVPGGAANAELGADAGAARAQDAATLTLGRAAPDPMLDPVLQRVLEAFDLDRTTGAHFAGMVDANTIGREEERGFPAAAMAIEHPYVLGVVTRKRVVIHWLVQRYATFVGSQNCSQSGLRFGWFAGLVGGV